MLTGRAKAYSSSYPQAVTHRSTNRAWRRVTSFQPKRVTNDATPTTPVAWRRLVNDIDLSRLKTPKNPKKPYFGVQGHPRSLNSAPIESQQSPGNELLQEGELSARITAAVFSCLRKSLLCVLCHKAGSNDDGAIRPDESVLLSSAPRN